jgi:uncharacterized protein YggT (Ycf19 family)
MIRFLINVYIFILIFESIISFLPQYNKHLWVLRLRQIANFGLNPIRRLMPREAPVDFSPLILIAGLKLFEFLW